MAGFASDSGAREIVYANNVDFSGSLNPQAQILTNGELLIGSATAPNIRPGVLTSPDGSVTIAYSSPNITLTNSLGTARFPITPFVVGPVGQAGYQTIQSALNAANAAGGGSVYIQTGMYTENLTFYPNVQIVGVTGNSDETGVGTDITISGTHTPADTGYTTISNVYLESTGDIFFSTDSGTCDIALQNCNVGITGSGYTFNLVNWTGQLIKYDVQDNSINNGVVNNTAGANCFFENSNMGAGSANSMITSGRTTMKRIDMSCPWTAGSGTVVIADFATFEWTVTMNGTSGGEFNFCRFSPTVSGGGAGIVWNSSTLLEVEMCIIDSTSTYALDGTGTGDLILGSVGFVEGTSINPAITTVALGGFVPNAFGTTGQVWTSNGQGNVPTFQSASASGAITTITGNSGGAQTPLTGNFNVVGTGSITTVGTANTETVELTGLTNHTVLVGAGTATVTKVGPGTAGQVLQSGGASADPAYSTATYPATAGTSGNVLTSNGTNFTSSALPASGIATINGDTGSITGSTVTIYANNAATACGSSVKFVNSGTTSTLNVSDSNNSTFIGNAAGKASATGTLNTALGTLAMSSITSGTANIAIGKSALPSNATGNLNVAIGQNACNGVTGSINIGIGDSTFNSATSGSGNVSIGHLSSYTSTGTNNSVMGTIAYLNGIGGSSNVIIGVAAGNGYTGSESSNIVIGTSVGGTAGESNVTRIGTGQGSCFISGIQGVTVSNAVPVTINSSTGQLGVGTVGVTSIAGTANQIAASASTGAVTLSTPSTFIAPGSIAATTSVTATLGNITATSGNLALPATTATVGQITSNTIPVFHTYNVSNTFAGPGAGNFTTSGTFNIGIGYRAGTALTTGSKNILIGEYDLGFTQISTGTSNIAIGTNTLNATSGSYNIAIGNGVGFYYSSSESSNILLNSFGNGDAGESNTLRIGNATGTGNQELNKAFICGINGITVTGTPVLVSSSDQLGIAVSSRRFKENIKDIGDLSSSVLKLRPVKFNYNVGEDRSQQTGLIAEEVNEIMPALVVYDASGLPQTVKYQDLPVLLLSELQKALKRIEVLEEKLLKQ